jgi:hypothetical protein
MKNSFLYNNIIKLNQSYINVKKLKKYQLTKLYKVINLDCHFKLTKNSLVFRKKNYKLTKLLRYKKYLILKKYKKYKIRFLTKFFYSTFNYLLKLKFKKKNRFELSKRAIRKLKIKRKLRLKRRLRLKKYIQKFLLKKRFTLKTIYINKWWFYFLKRIYPYISISYFEFKLKKILKKIHKLLTNANLKNIYKIFFKFALVNNLCIFFNKNYILLIFNYIDLLKFFAFYHLKNKYLNLFKNSCSKNWLTIIYNFSSSFGQIFYRYNILTIFYINFIFKKYIFFKIFNIYLNYLVLFIYNKFQYLKNKLTYFSNIEIYYDLIKYKDNTKLFIAVTPQNLIITINRRYKKGFVFQKY